ncbi:hypothetical protein ACIQGZ_07850 [Streptomyces sp. NPDC092296]|uniref:hypothetical protein n=1 Tax=Streptomyces sp. NPDC092296 TaxID=3366012 RepID=UPI0038228F31
MADTAARGAAEWLAAAAADPSACRRAWDRNPPDAAPLRAGRLWDLLTVPGVLGRPALEVLRGRAVPPGPVLDDPAGGTLGFLVPVGTADRWIGTGTHCAGDGAVVPVPHPRRSGGGLRWLVPPDGSGRLNDPALLELALHEAAAALADPGGDPRP